jgi:hypothetical protein
MKKKVLKRVCSTAMGALMFVCLPLSTFAREIDVSSQIGQLSIDLAGETEDLILTGTNTLNGSVELKTVPGTDKIVILRNLSMDTSEITDENDYRAALSITGNGNVIIELDGTNSLKSSSQRAGLLKKDGGTLTIKDDNETSGSLFAEGGEIYPRIGGDMAIVIDGGTINAIGGKGAAGIGGALFQPANVTINGGTITATGGEKGAGIGGGYFGFGNITINDGTITAIGGNGGAGIGGSGIIGSGRFDGAVVTINGGTVTAFSEGGGAGIGGHTNSNGSVITISKDATVYAAGGSSTTLITYNYCEGAAIGEGGAQDHKGTDTGLNISGLYTTGSVTTFAAGTTLEEIKANSVNGVTVRGTVPDPNEVKEPETTDDETDKETPGNEQPPKEEPPVYTERSCIADVNVAALIAAALKADPNAKEINIEFGDNICLTPDILKDLFADSRVSKNCMFTHKGKRYVLRVNAVNTASKEYADAFDALSKEEDGMAGFLRVAQLFEKLNVTAKEIK